MTIQPSTLFLPLDLAVSVPRVHRPPTQPTPPRRPQPVRRPSKAAVQHIAYLRLSQPKATSTRSGQPRLWLEGRRLLSAGFEPGARYDVSLDVRHACISLDLAPASGRRTVHRRRRSDSFSPVVDIRNEALAQLVGTLDLPHAPRFRATFYPGRVVIELHPEDAATSAAEARRQAAPHLIEIGSVFHGGGFLDAALHAGLQEAGMHPRLRWAVERDSRYLEASFHAHPDLWRAGAKAILADLDDVPPTSLPPTTLLTAGIPCTGSSWQGRVARGLDTPEDHPDAGHLFLTTAALICLQRPQILVVENVPEFRTTAGWQALTQALGKWGYVVETDEFSGPNFGTLDMRRRMVSVARRPHLPPMLAAMEPPPSTRPQRVADILDPIPADHPSWKPYEHVHAKAARDKAAGHNLQTPVYTGSETQTRTLVKGYGDGTKSWQPFVRHPTDPTLMRKFTKSEHARLKGVPTHTVATLPENLAHQVMGQGVIWPIFKSLGLAIARALGFTPTQPQLAFT